MLVCAFLFFISSELSFNSWSFVHKGELLKRSRALIRTWIVGGCPNEILFRLFNVKSQEFLQLAQKMPCYLKEILLEG